MLWKSKINNRIVKVFDFITSALSITLTIILWKYLWRDNPNINMIVDLLHNRNFYILILLSGFILVSLFDSNKAYNFKRFTSLSSEFKICFKVIIIGTLVEFFLMYALGIYIPRSIFLFLFFSNIIFFLSQKTIVVYAAKYYRKHSKKINTIIIGTGERTNKLINLTERKYELLINVIGILTKDDTKIGSFIEGKKVIGNYSNLAMVLKEYNPEEIIITLNSDKFNIYKEIIQVCENEGVKISFVSDFLSLITKEVVAFEIADINFIHLNMVKRSDVDLLIKRMIDIFGAVFGLIIFSPFILVGLLGILISDGWPLVYPWRVVGINKKPFTSWKIRTMIKDADKLKEKLLDQNEMDGPVFKIKNDPRILTFGQWLRKYSIDETLQFISVLKGDMSLVGPRPAGPHELNKYSSWHRRKLSIKPGMTCLWQVNGRNDIKSFDDWVQLDLEYVDNWTLWKDFEILLKTIFVVFRGSGK